MKWKRGLVNIGKKSFTLIFLDEPRPRTSWITFRSSKTHRERMGHRVGAITGRLYAKPNVSSAFKISSTLARGARVKRSAIDSAVMGSPVLRRVSICLRTDWVCSSNSEGQGALSGLPRYARPQPMRYFGS